MKRLTPSLLLVVCAACSGEESVAPVYTSVMQTLTFEREDPKGVSLGMNLDGWVSGTNDDRTCRKADFVDPAGAEGIDNELARLLPLVDLAGENAVEALIQTSINEGQLLVMLDVTVEEDGTATLEVQRGADSPLLGTDGFLLPGQTLALHESPMLGVTSGTLVGSTIETAPADVELPVIVFSQLYVVTLKNAVFRIELGEDGYVSRGLIAGGLPVDQLIEVLRTAGNFAGDFEALFGDAVRDSGDLARDDAGNCTWMSAAVTFDAVSAFKFQ